MARNGWEAVEIARVDDKMKPIGRNGKRISCDALILSVGLTRKMKSQNSWE